MVSEIGFPWTTARDWARSGLWVRRWAWSDPTRWLRYDAGPGSVRAVAVLVAEGAPKRAVRSEEFGQAEFEAQDWTRETFPVPDVEFSVVLTCSWEFALGFIAPVCGHALDAERAVLRATLGDTSGYEVNLTFFDAVGNPLGELTTEDSGNYEVVAPLLFAASLRAAVPMRWQTTIFWPDAATHAAAAAWSLWQAEMLPGAFAGDWSLWSGQNTL